MKLSQLQVLIAAAERGSAHGASRHLNIAQPAISRHVQQLEVELGVKLFERSAHGLVATPVGELVTRRAKIIQSEVQRTLDEVDQFKGVSAGTITLSLSAAAHSVFLPRIFKPFRRRFPGVRLDVVESQFSAVEADLRDGLIDIYVGPIDDSLRSRSLVIEKLFPNELIVICRPHHPLGFSTSLRPLTDAEWITTPAAPDVKDEVSTIFEMAGLPPPPLVARAESWLSIVSIVGSTDLLASVPLEFAMGSNFVRRVPVQKRSYGPMICSARSARQALAPATQHLLDLIDRSAANYAQGLYQVNQ